MSEEDREKWNAKWAEHATYDMEVSPLLVRYSEQLRGGTALDLACGMGQNALWLAERGYLVTAVDISPVGLAMGRAEAAQRRHTVNWVEADLETYDVPQNAFDVVVVIRFLERGLLSAIASAIRSGGWLFYQTWNMGRLTTNADISRAFLLESGELEAAFEGLEVVEAEDTSDLSHIVCRRG